MANKKQAGVTETLSKERESEGLKAMQRLRGRLTEAQLDAMEQSHREFHENFKPRRLKFG